MKIVYIAGSEIPSRSANSIHVMKMCQALTQNGHEVVLCVPDKSLEYEKNVSDIYEYYGVKDHFEVRRIAWSTSFSLKNCMFGFLCKFLVSQLKPDIVYARHISAAFFASMAGNQVIFESHHPADQEKIDAWLFRKMITSKSLIRMVVITHALKKYYVSKYPQLTNVIIVAADGADPVDANVEPIQLKTKNEQMLVGYVGSLYPGKGMEVVSRVAQTCPWADFHVIGGTEKDLKIWEERCIAIPNIRFHGYVKHASCEAYIKAFDVVLLPNQRYVATYGASNLNIAQWTSPLKVFEYMAARKAIISSDLPALREVLRHEHNALLCDPGDPIAWKQALTRLRDKKELRDEIAEAAFIDFSSSYSWKKRAGRVIAGEF